MVLDAIVPLQKKKKKKSPPCTKYKETQIHGTPNVMKAEDRKAVP